MRDTRCNPSALVHCTVRTMHGTYASVLWPCRDSRVCPGASRSDVHREGKRRSSGTMYTPSHSMRYTSDTIHGMEDTGIDREKDRIRTNTMVHTNDLAGRHSCFSLHMIGTGQTGDRCTLNTEDRIAGNCARRKRRWMRESNDVLIRCRQARRLVLTCFCRNQNIPVTNTFAVF